MSRSSQAKEPLSEIPQVMYSTDIPTVQFMSNKYIEMNNSCMCSKVLPMDEIMNEQLLYVFKI